jgi:two-component system, chemotaxis family, sensor kinase Cph1
MASLNERSNGLSESPPLKGWRILVVEDQSLIAMEMQDCLEKNGATVVGPVGRVERALNVAENANLEAALLDVNLHGERCWPVADALIRRAIPFAFATGFETRLVMPERFAGCLVLSKPFREQDILAVLKQMLERDDLS